MTAPSPADQPLTPPALQWALAGFFVLGGAAVLIAQALTFQGGPPDADWAAAAARVRQDAQPGDAFMIAPHWQSGPRTHLQTLPWMPAEAPTWADLDPYPRLWLLAEAGREEAAQAALSPDLQTQHVARFGDVTLLLATRAPSPSPAWEALRDLQEAQLTRERPSLPPLPCRTWDTAARAWRCPPGGAWVGETLQVVTNDNHRCIWAQPADPAGTLRLRWEHLTLGQRLEGHYGQPIDAIRSERGAPVTFTVHVNGAPVHARTFDLHDEGFLPWSAPLPATSGDDTLEITLQSPDPSDRFFCFTARSPARP